MDKPGVDFINCFTPYAYLLCLALNFCARKKLLKSWVQSEKSLAHGANQFMKLISDLFRFLQEMMARKLTQIWTNHLCPTKIVKTKNMTIIQKNCNLKLYMFSYFNQVQYVLPDLRLNKLLNKKRASQPRGLERQCKTFETTRSGRFRVRILARDGKLS